MMQGEGTTAPFFHISTGAEKSLRPIFIPMELRGKKDENRWETERMFELWKQLAET